MSRYREVTLDQGSPLQDVTGDKERVCLNYLGCFVATEPQAGARLMGPSVIDPGPDISKSCRSLTEHEHFSHRSEWEERVKYKRGRVSFSK